MAATYKVLTAYEVYSWIPYRMMCEIRYGCLWNTGRRRRQWLKEFSESERAASTRLFNMAHDWAVGRGVPDKVRMTEETYQLWKKLAKFCASI